MRSAPPAMRCGTSSGAGDSAYRYGGEEFVGLILLTRASDALAAAERMRAAIEDLGIPNARNTPFGRLTVSGA